MADRVRGLVVSVQDYTVHDGYGLRSLVFLKGCHLRCKWCQNPECLTTRLELVYRRKLCIECKRCLEVCSEGAILKDDLSIDFAKCTRCMKCVEHCPTGARKRVGQWTTPEQVLQNILRYKPFYDGSDRGGVTLSGGELLDQPEFSLALLKLVREYGIHATLETSSHCDLDVYQEMVANADLVLTDIKHMDDQAHQAGTRVSNAPVLRNITWLAREQSRVECAIRIPLIPGFNDDEENVRRTAEFLADIGLKKLDLLPFNDLASAKYREMEWKWKYANAKRQSADHLKRLREIGESFGLTVTIGGLW